MSDLQRRRELERLSKPELITKVIEVERARLVAEVDAELARAGRNSVTRERDEALAVIERAKVTIGDVTEQWKPMATLDILDTAPADALRQVKAEAWPEPQTEPTDAQVKTALELWSANEWRYGAASAMRAALRAALNTREEDRG